MDRLFFALGSLLAFLAVALGAFAAHGLKEKLEPAMLAVFKTGVEYQFLHALGLLAVSWAVTRWPGWAAVASGWLLVAGIAVFSGTLYGLSLTGIRWLGAITPIGGVSFLAGWMALAWAALRGGPQG
jgi:uncharacterized membrane protein YgdD (TMEM256/DUF423 family)